MDQDLRATIQKHIDITVKALRKNNFDAHYLPDKDTLLAKIAEMMPKGCSCAMGGSMTLRETGVEQFLAEGDFTVYSSRPTAPMEESLKTLTCDVYLTSSNAITMDGRLYNMDGRANRVAALCFGPQKVIVVAGYNKIVADLDAARTRVRHVAAPANATRLSRQTPCVKTGVCQDCASPDRICCQEVITSFQRTDRISVLIVGEAYGY